MKLLACVSFVVVAACGPSSRQSPYPGQFTIAAQEDPSAIWLSAHNRERAAFGSPPLQWDPALASHARAYANKLARIGRLQHSPGTTRPGQGENLWMGSRGAYPPEAMIATWASERRNFRRGIFPAVSRTGNWRDAGHYTQVVWPGTTRLGCGLASSARWDFLVCRYSPPGNRDGARI